MRIKLAALALVAGLGMVVSGCTSNNTVSPPPVQVTSAPKGVYTMTNSASGNAIAFYRRAADGSLTYVDSYPTGGDGSGDVALNSQGSLIFNPDLNLFFCVNAGDGIHDGTVSMLRLNNDGSLTLLSHIDSGGVFPVSLTQTSQTLVVLNAGDGTASNPANITAFSISGGRLTTYPASQVNALLSTDSPDPAEVSFTPSGRNVVVTERGTDKIDVFGVDQNGHGFTKVNVSNGHRPYGFAFGPNGNLLVSEAAGGSSSDGAASSYSINGSTGVLTNISPSVDSHGQATFWMTVAGNNAYVTNAGSNTVARYAIGSGGGLTFKDTTPAGTEPIYEDVTDGNDFLYVFVSGADEIGYFPIKSNGSLGTMQTYNTNVPTYPEGLVAR